MKKLYPIILLAFIGLSFKANAQIVNIPDANFKAALIANGVHDSAGYITVDTAKAFKGNLDVSARGILDLTGIETFAAITHLNCGSNYLTSLNLSFNTALTELDCYNDSLTSLNVSSNTNLDTLYCFGNNLTGLNVSYNTALTFLYCFHNSLTNLDVSSNAALAYLSCYDNSLTGLNLSSNTALSYLACFNNQLTGLNVKNGNNHTMSRGYFIATNNPFLTCIEVDDTIYSKAIWTNIDAWAHFSTDCSPLSVSEIKSVTDVNIYPNPFASEFEIETHGMNAASLNIYDVLGQLMYNRNLTDNKISIDMNAAPAGFYLIQIADADKNIINRKIIKQ